jgi:hypothetical protein
MTISRGQMKRQLYMGGGIMDIVPREPAILGGIKKAVKKVTKGVKDIAKSDLGKAALLYAGTAGLGALGAKLGSGVATSGFGGIFNPGNVLKNLGASKSFLADKFLGPVISATGEEPFRKGTALSKALGIGDGKIGGIGKLTTLGLVSKFLTTELGMTEEQAEAELARDPSGYLERYYRNLNPPGNKDPEVYEAEVREFVTANTSEYMAEGGRIGFDNGSPRFDDIDFGAMQDIMPKLEGRDDKSIPMPKLELEDDIPMLGPDGEIKVKPLRGIENLQASVQYELPFGEPLFVVKQAGRLFGVFEQKDGSRILLPMDKSGSRLDLANAGPVLPPDPTQPVNPFGPKPGDFGIEEDIPIKMASNMENDKILEALFEKYIDMGMSPIEAEKAAFAEFERMSKREEKFFSTPRGLAAIGGRMDSASDNAMQAAGIEGLPIRQNPKGVKELDLRETGGFIQPVGIKEKEDDIPAMLSNNEFVFTADAVRGMGGGNVNVGAQRMYDMMKKLEAGGRV